MFKVPSYLCLVLCLLALPGCYERHEWRQKLTMVVETPTGEVSGSGIVQVNATYWGQLPATGTEVEYDIAGEATMVEVAPQKFLFVLLPGAHGNFPTYARERFRGMSRQEWLREIPRQTLPAVIPLETAPMIVTFTDVSDPTSMVEVDPLKLDMHFGEGHEIVSMSIEITDEEIHFGAIEEALPIAFFQGWEETHKAAINSGGFGNPYFETLASRFGRGAFVRDYK